MCRKCPDIDKSCCICGEPGGWHFARDFVSRRISGRCLGTWSKFYCRLHFDAMEELNALTSEILRGDLSNTFEDAK